jgi:hypothetical protein
MRHSTTPCHGNIPSIAPTPRSRPHAKLQYFRLHALTSVQLVGSVHASFANEVKVTSPIFDTAPFSSTCVLNYPGHQMDALLLGLRGYLSRLTILYRSSVCWLVVFRLV